MTNAEFINGLIKHFTFVKISWEEELSRAKDRVAFCEETIRTYEETIEDLKKMANEVE